MKRFENAKVGDKVRCLLNGDGEIFDVKDTTIYGYPIKVRFEYQENIRNFSYTLDGFLVEDNINPSLSYIGKNGDSVTERPKTEIKCYPVATPVTNLGNIIFNKRQYLYIQAYDEMYFFNSGSHMTNMSDCSEKFVWVPCKRSELKPGDTGYHHSLEECFCNFGISKNVCKILNDTEYVYVHNGRNIRVDSVHFNYWYKLTEKSKL